MTEDLKDREPSRKVPFVIAVYNQKGGVAKTTTATNLALCLAAYGQSVLLVDLDSQGNATSSLGVVPPPSKGVYDVLTGVHTAAAVLRQTKFPQLNVLPATDELSSIDIELALTEAPHGALSDVLRSRDIDVDYVIIDCPPTFSLLPINALVAADSVLIPIHTDPLAHDGLTKAWGNIHHLQKKFRLNLGIHGLLLTMMDRGDASERDLEAIIRNEFGEKVYKTVIPRDSSVIAAASKDVPVAIFAPDSAATQAYVSFTAEFLRRETVLLSRKRPGRKKLTRQERHPDPAEATANLKAWSKQLVKDALHDFIADSKDAPPLPFGMPPRAPSPTAAPTCDERDAARRGWRIAAAVLLITVSFLAGVVAGTAERLQAFLPG